MACGCFPLWFISVVPAWPLGTATGWLFSKKINGKPNNHLEKKRIVEKFEWQPLLVVNQMIAVLFFGFLWWYRDAKSGEQTPATPYPLPPPSSPPMCLLCLFTHTAFASVLFLHTQAQLGSMLLCCKYEYLLNHAFFVLMFWKEMY